MIHVVRSKASRQEIDEMLVTLENYIPGQGNRKMEVEDPVLRNRIEAVARDLLGGIEVERLESHS